jgi:hypothetical protein
MSDLDNSSLNFNRHYKFTFFDITGQGPFTIVPVPNVFIQDSVNFSFSYTVTNSLLNTCTFRFYNLSEETIGLFTSQQQRRGFQFDAWYGNDTSGNVTIFKGLSYTSNTYYQGPDTITEITGCDVFLNLMYKGIVQYFPAGTTYLAAVQTLLGYYGNIVSLNSLSNQFLSGSYKAPTTIMGQFNDVLKTIAADAGLIYSIQLGQVTMIPKDLTVVRPTSIQQINNQNGLVGYPRATALSVQLFPVTFFDNQALDRNVSLISVTTLMRPYNLYDKVYVKSRQFDGPYGVLSLTQTGEWRSNAWYSVMTLWPDTNAGQQGLLVGDHEVQ